MFSFFKSTETKRIENLFGFYKKMLQANTSKESALMDLWGELKNRNGLLKNQYGFQERSLEAKKSLLKEIFSSLDLNSYDVYQAIEFIIAWEFPKNYNEKLTVESIRSRTSQRLLLRERVKKIGGSILN